MLLTVPLSFCGCPSLEVGGDVTSGGGTANLSTGGPETATGGHETATAGHEPSTSGMAPPPTTTESDTTANGLSNTTSASVGTDSTGSSTGSALGSSSGSSGPAPSACAEMDCDGCFSCVEDGDCVDVTSECDGIIGCAAISDCLRTCQVAGLCLDPCCSGARPEAITAALALADCRAGVCDATCGGLNAAPCR